jgi:hypothetical protein
VAIRVIWRSIIGPGVWPLVATGNGFAEERMERFGFGQHFGCSQAYFPHTKMYSVFAFRIYKSINTRKL